MKKKKKREYTNLNKEMRLADKINDDEYIMFHYDPGLSYVKVYTRKGKRIIDKRGVCGLKDCFDDYMNLSIPFKELPLPITLEEVYLYNKRVLKEGLSKKKLLRAEIWLDHPEYIKAREEAKKIQEENNRDMRECCWSEPINKEKGPRG